MYIYTGHDEDNANLWIVYDILISNLKKYIRMKFKLFKCFLYVILLFSPLFLASWDQMPMPRLHVDGRYFKDDNGNIINLHGFAQTYSPWFNGQGTKWNNYDVSTCLSYNQGLIDQILAAGWKVNFMRLHMDPYWSNNPGTTTTGENDISQFNFDRFKTYFQSVFVPMAKYAISHGLYVVMRPPGVCPAKISVGDAYQQYLIKVWNYVSADAYIKDNPDIMFELANEPVGIYQQDGSTAAGFKEMKDYFQPITDGIRANCDNIVLVPGLSWQANYEGFAEYPVEGKNIGYAVHCYPGWYNSGSESTPDVNYSQFKDGWDKQIMPVANFAPIIVTEMDWAPQSYNASWGKGVTGTAGGTGFGANFKKIADETGNVSWLIFTGPDLMAQFVDVQGAGNTFLTDPEACPWPTYHWYQDYANAGNTLPDITDPANSNYYTVSSIAIDHTSFSLLPQSHQSFMLTATFKDGHTENVTNEAVYQVANANIVKVKNCCLLPLDAGSTTVTATYTDRLGHAISLDFIVKSTSFFPLTSDGINPSIWETGTFDESTHTLVTGKYGFGGWKYANGIDLSSYKYIVIEMNRAQSNGASFRLYDENNYWTTPSMTDIGSATTVKIELAQLVKNGTSTPLNLQHIYIAGFWSYGGGDISIKDIYLSNDGVNPATDISAPTLVDENTLVDVYNLSGKRLYTRQKRADVMKKLEKGVYIINHKCIVIR
jgi:endoglucanase